MNQVAIGSHRVGPGAPCFVIAEAGVNHDGDLARARRLVEIAAEAGADAVKFQTFSADRLATPSAPKAAYQEVSTPSGETQQEMLRRLELKHEQHPELIELAARLGLMFLSTPFDERSADFLETIGLPAFKLPSGELTNLPFLAHVARKKRPLIVSTGMATLEEVRSAVDTIRSAGDPPLILLHCVSNYPAEASTANLRAMATMEAAFGVPVGYSDHTLGSEAALAAVALGARVIEKHFTIDRRAPGPDHAASMEPGELRALIRSIRTVESALGHGRKEPAASELATADVARKSLVALDDIAEGTVLTAALIGARRPGTGMPPGETPRVLGRRAKVRIPAGTLLKPEMLA